MTKARKNRHKPYYLRGSFDDQKHSIEYRLPDFESYKKVIKEKNYRIKALRRTDTPESLVLADKLSNCTSEEGSCRSTACAVCSRSYQKWMFQQMVDMYENKECYSVTIIFFHDMLSSEELENFDHYKLLFKRLSKQMERLDFTQPAIGRYEFDYHKYRL